MQSSFQFNAIAVGKAFRGVNLKGTQRESNLFLCGSNAAFIKVEGYIDHVFVFLGCW